MFCVTTLPLGNPPKNERCGIDYKEDFFGRCTNLTVSGQLEAELGAMALSEVYTFGPTFTCGKLQYRQAPRGIWMIEPEVAFNDII